MASTQNTPSTLTELNFYEICQSSAIREDLALLNFHSLDEELAFEYLFYSERLDRRNDGRLRDKDLWAYRHLSDGGWWCSGLDPLNDWQPMTWGCFKPNVPRHSMDGKLIKYEHPPKTPMRAFFLDVPHDLWTQISLLYHVSISEEERLQGFWAWVVACNLPVILCEGAKKAASLLSVGYIAVGLPGISGGYRSIRDSISGDLMSRSLIPELQCLLSVSRELYFCFDYETKPKTIRDVRNNLKNTSRLLVGEGRSIKVISLPGPEKGADDFIVAQGLDAFVECYQSAADFSRWLCDNQSQLTYEPTLLLNQEFLGSLPIPGQGMALIKSPKGTGKTQGLVSLIREATQTGRRVLVIGHRIQLVRAICKEIGINYIEDVRESETGSLLGYGLCIDSLHSTSRARFNAQDWKGAIVILDEFEQVVWHVLNSSTCYENRVNILECLRELLPLVLSTRGLVIAQDADLSDVSVDYLRAVSSYGEIPWVCINEWKPPVGCQTTFYHTKHPTYLLLKADDFLDRGDRIILHVDSQKDKSRWGSKGLEFYFQSKYPDKKILRIDSETVSDPQHAAFGIVEHLNDSIGGYDIVIATPTIGTGVSIDIRGHFKGVFGIFQGAIPDSEVRQAIARVREQVPRYLWCRSFSTHKIGNGSPDPLELAQSSQNLLKYNAHLLKLDLLSLDDLFDPVSLRTYCHMASRVNASMGQYRVSIQQGLADEGHQLTVLTDAIIPPVGTQSVQSADPIYSFSASESLKASLSSARDVAHLKEAVSVSESDSLTESQYQVLKKRHSKTASERHSQRRHELLERYGIPVSPDLVIKDDDGWFPKLRLHYFLQHSEFIRPRDLAELLGHLERGGGKVALQDVHLFSLPVEMLTQFGVLGFLVPSTDATAAPLCGVDALLINFGKHVKMYSAEIKRCLGFWIDPDAPPIQILGMFLSKLGLTLTATGRRCATDDPTRPRTYEYLDPEDGREEVFTAWLERDRARDPEDITALETRLCEMLVRPHPVKEENYNPSIAA